MASLDINIDINQLNGEAGNPAGGRRAHPASDVPNALIDHKQPVVAQGKAEGGARSGPNYPLYHEFWDADLQAYTYLNDFLAQYPGWLGEFADVALSENRLPPQQMSRDQLNAQIIQMLDRVKDRGPRVAEIINQDDAEGAISCWTNLLNIDPARQPATSLLIRVARRVGEHVVMCLKDHFRSPRPPQLSLAVNPLIDPPATPSFPAGHAVQSYLISYLLADRLKCLPQHELPEDHPELAKGLLFDIAERVSDNRVVAGIHYPVDIEAGRAVAIACFKKLRSLPSVAALQARAAEEFSQYA